MTQYNQQKNKCKRISHLFLQLKIDLKAIQKKKNPSHYPISIQTKTVKKSAVKHKNKFVNN